MQGAAALYLFLWKWTFTGTVCFAAAIAAIIAHKHAVDLQNIYSLSKGFATEWLLLSGGSRIWGSFPGCCGNGISNHCLPYSLLGAVTGTGWHCGHVTPLPVLRILPMKWSLSAKVHLNIVNLWGLIFVCFPPHTAEAYTHFSPLGKMNLKTFCVREGREIQTIFLRPQNFSDIHFKVFITAFHPVPWLLRLNSLPGNRWDANLFLAVCLLWLNP